MISKTYRVLLLATTLAGAAVQARAGNIVSDPGFESGVPSDYPGPMGDGWIVTAGTGAICNNNHTGCGNAGFAHTGSQMGYLDWDSSLNTITQDLTTVIGHTYTISYWVADEKANFLQVTFGGTTLFNGAAPTNGVNPSNYVQYTFMSTATSTSTVLAFTGQRTAGGNGTLLDDVSVAPGAVPEPATWVLTSAALLALRAFRRLQ